MDTMESIKHSLTYLAGIASGLSDASPRLSEDILSVIANLDVDIQSLMDEQRADTPEQPDPTAEALQEAAKTEALDELLSEHPEKHLSDCAVHNAPAMEAGPCDCGGDDVFEQADLPTADDVKGVLASPTMGSCSDVSDDDVRAAGGEPVDSGTQTKIVGVTEPNYPNGSAMPHDPYDFGPKA